MMPIRNPSLVELWAQAANPLDEYLAALKDIQAWLNRPQREGCEALLRPAHEVMDRTSNGYRSQFELVAELSQEMVDTPRCISLMPERCISIVSHPICAATFDMQALSRPAVLVRPVAMQALLSQAALAAGVDIPGLIKGIRCGFDQRRPLMETLEASAPNRVTDVQPQEPRRDDGGQPGREPVRKNAPIPVPPGSSPAVAGLHDQIETWVNEGGAGDDVA